MAQAGLSKSYVHSAPGRMTPVMKVLKKDGFIHYRDAAKDERVLNKESKIKEGIGSILVVPVLVRDEMTGQPRPLYGKTSVIFRRKRSSSSPCSPRKAACS